MNVMELEAVKYYTPSEATRALALIRGIVKDLRDESRELKLLANDLEEGIFDDPVARRCRERVERYHEELDELGCYYEERPAGDGVVKFPAIIDNREVFLCWRADEEEVMYYHEIDDGYEARKLIPVDWIDV